jgi:glycosyltransferase involved in cell wall biosynthesis
MSVYTHPTPAGDAMLRLYDAEQLRLEAVTVCIGFDDMLDATLQVNMPQLDTMIVVTSHDDAKTQAVVRKHGATLVVTDLHKKNGRNFNKGAAINAGFNYFQWHGWRLHLDADIALPPNFHRMVFNHHVLHRDCIYGADRVDVIGKAALQSAQSQLQHQHGCLVHPRHEASLGALGSRYVDTLHGYVPIGYFQMWHASCQQPYPYSSPTRTAWARPRMTTSCLPSVGPKLSAACFPAFLSSMSAEPHPDWGKIGTATAASPASINPSPAS